jgi:3-carboxy-cis,cis-muconate cycloisomerase
MSSIFQDAVFGGLFGDPEAMALWSAEAQLERFRTVEAALSKALAEVGLVPPDQGARAAAHILTVPVDGVRLAEGCAKDGLPIPNFVAQLKEYGPVTDHSGHK